MLNGKEVEKQIIDKGLIKDFIDLKTQVTSNGFDLTIASLSEFKTQGALDFSNNERSLPETKEISPHKQNPKDKFGWWHLKKGAYKVKTNETVSLPNDLTAFACPRSSLLRMGAFTQTAAWDAGFVGKSEFILVVENPKGVKIKQNARIAQLIFFKINEAHQGYNGIYQQKE
jgi:deoxycytidine triphosphate deaminase